MTGSPTYINLGCGSVFVDSPDWINLDFTPASPRVRRANLHARLPLPSDDARLVYASHFLEHIPKPEVDAFLRECHRVLQPGGVLRLVLPDLQEMATSYLHYREAGNHERADFLVLEIIDQCVRRESGGELGRLYRRLRNEPHPDPAELIAFVRERTGEALIASMNGQTQNPGGGNSSALARLGRLPGRLYNRLQRLWIRAWLAPLPAAFRAQNVSLAGVGERHHWLWDFHQLQQALEAAGFTAVQRRAADSSAIADFPFHPLDLDADGRPRKGTESMYVEARKPD